MHIMFPFIIMNGKYLYELYSSGQSIQWKNYKGDPLPQWEELQKDRQDGWDDLADTMNENYVYHTIAPHGEKGHK